MSNEVVKCHFCGTYIDKEHYCHGCKHYICMDCAGDAPWGPHNVDDHKEEQEEDEYDHVD